MRTRGGCGIGGHVASRGDWRHQSGDADKRTGLMSMAYGDFAAFMADVDKAFSTWDKVKDMCVPPRPAQDEILSYEATPYFF